MKKQIFVTLLTAGILTCVPSADSSQPDFNWKEEPKAPNPPKISGSVPAPPAPSSAIADPFSRFEAMRQRMEAFRNRFFQASDPFTDDDFFPMSTPPVAPAIGSALQSQSTGLPPVSQVEFRETSRFLIVEIPATKSRDSELKFEVKGQYLKMQSQKKVEKHEESEGRQSRMYSFSSASSAIGLPVPVKPEFTQQIHGDKIVLTFEKL